MIKILSFIMVGLLVLVGLGAGVVTGKEINQEIQRSYNDTKKINSEKFDLEVKYSYLRSYPNGGGIFIIKITPKNGFSGYVSLQVNVDPNLNIKLDREFLNEQSPVAELSLQPNELTEIKTYEIELTATYHEKSRHLALFNWICRIKVPILSHLISRLFKRFDRKSGDVHLTHIDETLILEIEMFNWTSENLPEAIIKRDELIDWLETEHPEFGTFSGENWFAYITYPQHLIVEHWTFLYEKWEMRICYHVMIPPYDWSKVWLRPRGEVDAIFAAEHQSDGTTYEISVSDYPLFYGY